MESAPLERMGIPVAQVGIVAKFDQDRDVKLSEDESKGDHFNDYDGTGDGFIEAKMHRKARLPMNP